MAKQHRKYEDNSEGRYFVDKDCIACDNCVYLAPNHFALTPNYHHAIVTQQPLSDAEEARCFLALKACPVAAIGIQS